MKRQFLLGALALALAAGMTSGAMASHHHHVEYAGLHHADLDGRQFVSSYGARRGLSGVGEGTYCPAFSRCGAGLPN